MLFSRRDYWVSNIRDKMGGGQNCVGKRVYLKQIKKLKIRRK